MIEGDSWIAPTRVIYRRRIFYVDFYCLKGKYVIFEGELSELCLRQAGGDGNDLVIKNPKPLPIRQESDTGQVEKGL